MAEAAPVITVDGPGGSGKGTVSRLLAQRLGWHYLDSGALYRVVALAALRLGLDLDDGPALGRLAGELDVAFPTGAEKDNVLLDGDDVTHAIRTEAAGAAASRVAVQESVRSALLQRQRDFREYPGLVADGRDMGTVVFADAGVKIFLTASPEERARRRHKQLKDKGIDVSLSALSEDIAARDRQDQGRDVSPLVAADDAIQLDSTDLTPNEVVGEIMVWLGRAGFFQE